MNNIENLRNLIDIADRSIVEALALRQEIAAKIQEVKAEKGLQAMDYGREKDIRYRLRREAEELNVDPHIIEMLYDAIFSVNR